MTNNKLRIAAYIRTAYDDEVNTDCHNSVTEQRKVITDGCNRNFPLLLNVFFSVIESPSLMSLIH